jgi:chromosome segregation ATPase
MKFHPYAEIFPLIEGDDFAALVADIKAHGLREKIVTYNGKVLDGRNRFLACQKAKVDHKFKEFKGSDADALAFVMSLNDCRRHLSTSQRAMAASRHKQHLSSLNLDSGDVTAIAAEKHKVSRALVFQADKVREAGSKSLQQAVDSGEVSVSKAASVVDLPKAEQLKAATAKHAPEPERWEPEAVDEDAALEKAEKELAASVDKVMASDDRLSASYAEMKRQAAEIASLKSSRDSYQNRCAEILDRYKALQRKCEKLEKEIKILREREGIEA